MSARLPALAAALVLIAVAAAGCGVGEAGSEGRVSGVADTYLRALAEGDVTTACAQLTARAKAALGGACEAELRHVVARLGAEQLDAAADRGVEVDVTGDTGTALVRKLRAELSFVHTDDAWLVDGGYRLERR